MAGTTVLRATVHGRVQGVLFRDFVERRAAGLGLLGYVRNQPDGTVYVEAEGDRDKLEKLLAYLNAGPPAARVDRVDFTWSQGEARYQDFHVRR